MLTGGGDAAASSVVGVAAAGARGLQITALQVDVLITVPAPSQSTIDASSAPVLAYWAQRDAQTALMTSIGAALNATAGAGSGDSSTGGYIISDQTAMFRDEAASIVSAPLGTLIVSVPSTGAGFVQPSPGVARPPVAAAPAAGGGGGIGSSGVGGIIGGLIVVGLLCGVAYYYVTYHRPAAHRIASSKESRRPEQSFGLTAKSPSVASIASSSSGGGGSDSRRSLGAGHASGVHGSTGDRSSSEKHLVPEKDGAKVSYGDDGSFVVAANPLASAMAGGGQSSRFVSSPMHPKR